MGDYISSANENCDVKICAVIPCKNHSSSLHSVVEGIVSECPVIVVDDASDVPVVEENAISVIRLDRCCGKANALAVGFSKARELGFTHVLTLDADGQHDTSCASKFVEAAGKFPDSIIIGVRNFDQKDVPLERAFMNKFSNFWFWAETGVRIGDTQCGYRCYPLSLISKLRTDFGGFVYEGEILVRSIWAGHGLKEVGIPTIYTGAPSHYKTFSDTMKFSQMNAKLFFMSLFLSAEKLKELSIKK